MKIWLTRMSNSFDIIYSTSFEVNTNGALMRGNVEKVEYICRLFSTDRRLRIFFLERPLSMLRRTPCVLITY